MGKARCKNRGKLRSLHQPDPELVKASALTPEQRTCKVRYGRPRYIKRRLAKLKGVERALEWAAMQRL